MEDFQRNPLENVSENFYTYILHENRNNSGKFGKIVFTKKIFKRWVRGGPSERVSLSLPV